MLAGSLCLCSGGRADQSSGGDGTAGGQEYPAVTAALWPQREGEHRAVDTLIDLTWTLSKHGTTKNIKSLTTTSTNTMTWLEKKHLLAWKPLKSAEITCGALAWAVKVNMTKCFIITVVIFWFSGCRLRLDGESAQPRDGRAEVCG